MMISNHYPMITEHMHAWVLVGLIVVGGAALRHFLVRIEVGDPIAQIAWTIPIISGALAAALWFTEPAATPAYSGTVTDEEALTIVKTRCSSCHAQTPSDATIKKAPKGIALETLDELKRYAQQIETQAVKNKAMPLGNKTGMVAGRTGETGCVDKHTMKTIEQVNALKAAEFEKTFGDVAEHSPWVARNAAGDRPFVSRESMIRAFHEAVHSASETAQLALIRAHPDLATQGKAHE